MSVVNVFVSGRSGSGKTTAINHIKYLAQKKGYNAIHIKDYPLLYEMFQEDIKKGEGRFKPVDHGGFEIIDYAAFDDVLVILEEKIKKEVQYYKSLEGNWLILVEFARSDYRNALRNFTAGFLQDAYFFYVEAEVEACIQRIHERITHRLPGTAPGDYHFVPDTILRSYFNNQDDWHYMAHEFKKDFGMLKEVVAYRNGGSQEDLLEMVNIFVDLIFTGECIASDSAAVPLPAQVF